PHTRLDFTVDLTPPLLDVPGPLHTSAWHPLPVSGRTDPGSKVTVAGRVASVDDQGRFVVTLPAPQPRVVGVVATDAAGNSTQEQQPITVTPRRPPAPIRGRPDAFGRRVCRLRRLHELRESGRTRLQHRDRGRGSARRRRRHPLRLRPAPRRADLEHALPRLAHDTGGRSRRVPAPNAS